MINFMVNHWKLLAAVLLPTPLLRQYLRTHTDGQLSDLYHQGIISHKLYQWELDRRCCQARCTADHGPSCPFYRGNLTEVDPNTLLKEWQAGRISTAQYIQYKEVRYCQHHCQLHSHVAGCIWHEPELAPSVHTVHTGSTKGADYDAWVDTEQSAIRT